MHTENRRWNLLAEGDGKHFVVAFVGDQCMETEFVCEWDEKDESAPCYDKNVGCLVKYSWDNIGTDLMERNEDESQLLKVRLPVGYRCSGSGEDFEDYIYSVRPIPPGTEPRDAQILDPETGTVHLPHGTVDIDGNVTLNE